LAIQDDLQLLDLMMEDQEKQPGIYRPGPYWERYQTEIAGAIRRYGLRGFRSRPAISKPFADGNENPEWRWTGATGLLKRLARPLMSDYAAAYRKSSYWRDHWEGKFYSTLGLDTDIETLREGGRALSINGTPTAEIYILAQLRVRHFSIGKVRSLFEIGGGFGALPHLMAAKHGTTQIIYLDIPPILYVGTQYLRSFYPDWVVDYRDTRNDTTIRFQGDAPQILCLAPWQIDRLDAHVEMFWNAASFSEMTPEIVRNYAAKVSADRVCLTLTSPEGSQRNASDMDVLNAFGGGFTDLGPIDAIPPGYSHYVKSGHSP
jgi:hypothetical protein